MKVSKILHFIKRPGTFRPPYPGYTTVFSHPRSGTHFLEAFIAENFYRGEDLSLDSVAWGHWANRQVNLEGNKYGKLFGSHIFPSRKYQRIDYPMAYIYRDGRAVAYSIWKTGNFIHPKFQNLPFSDFLKMKLDWIGSPAFRSRETMTIARHWVSHVSGWIDLSKGNKNILVVRYEDLIRTPYKVYLDLHRIFFEHTPRLDENQMQIIGNVIGLRPNQGKIDAWKEIFTPEDDTFFRNEAHGKYLVET